jgi:hypothetical protein
MKRKNKTPIEEDPLTLPSPPVGEKVSEGRVRSNGAVHEISSLSELQEICRKPMLCEFELDGRKLRLPVHRLTAEEAELVQAIDREVIPPLIVGKTPYDNRYNFDDPGYKSRKIHAEKVARAVAVYYGCPLLREAQPGLADREIIFAFVQKQLSELLAQYIFLKIMGEGMEIERAKEVAERTNFTLPPGLTES